MNNIKCTNKICYLILLCYECLMNHIRFLSSFSDFVFEFRWKTADIDLLGRGSELNGGNKRIQVK